MFKHTSSAKHPIQGFIHEFDKGNELLFGRRGGHKTDCKVMHYSLSERVWREII